MLLFGWEKFGRNTEYNIFLEKKLPYIFNITRMKFKLVFVHFITQVLLEKPLEILL